MRVASRSASSFGLLSSRLSCLGIRCSHPPAASDPIVGLVIAGFVLWTAACCAGPDQRRAEGIYKPPLYRYAAEGKTDRFSAPT